MFNMMISFAFFSRAALTQRMTLFFVSSFFLFNNTFLSRDVPFFNTLISPCFINRNLLYCQTENAMGAQRPKGLRIGGRPEDSGTVMVLFRGCLKTRGVIKTGRLNREEI
jgi:hypothetical protein